MTTEQSEKVLKYVEANGPVSTLKLAELWQEDHQKIVGIVNSLLSLGEASIFHIQTILRPENNFLECYSILDLISRLLKQKKKVLHIGF